MLPKDTWEWSDISINNFFWQRNLNDWEWTHIITKIIFSPGIDDWVWLDIETRMSSHLPILMKIRNQIFWQKNMLSLAVQTAMSKNDQLSWQNMTSHWQISMSNEKPDILVKYVFSLTDIESKNVQIYWQIYFDTDDWRWSDVLIIYFFSSTILG